MEASSPDTEYPPPSELEQSQSSQSSPYFACSPRKLSMPSQLYIEDSDSEDYDDILEEEKTTNDKRIKYDWKTVEDEKLKKEYLTKSQIDFRHQHAIRGSSYGSVLRCVLHSNCDFKLRILWHGGSFG
jgi:hypothetical protein